jgi:FkbM family methyltransferase
MKINAANLLYAMGHPLRVLRYLKHRDRIPYEDIAKYLPVNPVILEAGTANGVNTVEMAEFWKQSRIYGFEPVPSAMALAESATKALRNRITLFPDALGDAASRLTMNVSGTGNAAETQSSSLLKPTGHLEEYDFVDFSETVEVDVVRLDDWARENQVPKIDFMWLDLQGYELIALQGAEEVLKQVSVIHIEVSHKPLFENGVLYPELRQWLGARGFKPRIDATFRLGGNVLFTR